jgi:hypothetical protein
MSVTAVTRSRGGRRGFCIHAGCTCSSVRRSVEASSDSTQPPFPWTAENAGGRTEELMRCLLLQMREVACGYVSAVLYAVSQKSTCLVL